MSTPQQLKERWETPEGKKVRQQIIEHISEPNWVKFLIGFPLLEEIKNGRDLRYIDLSNEELFNAYLNDTNLEGANLQGSNLMCSQLKNAYLSKAKLQKTNLESALLDNINFFDSDLSGSILKQTHMPFGNLVKCILNNSDLSEGHFIDCHFWSANLDFSKLENAIFNRADFYGASLINCEICNAKFIYSILQKTNLSNSIISDTDFTYSNICEANLENTELIRCRIYGASAWNLKANNNTKTKDLIISKDNEPKITLDNIEMAQFIYLILNNEKISNLITTMRTKTVLILGSFDNKSKLVLDKIKEILPKHNLIPIVFDFKPPMEHRFMETVKTLALLSNFVIVDLSQRSGQYYEISQLVNNIRVPFVTIAVSGTKVSGMLEDLNDYYWWSKDYFSYPKNRWEDKLPELIEKEIIPWAEEINNKLSQNKER